MSSVLEEAEKVGEFIVEFYNPQNHLLHSAVKVVSTAVKAIEVAADTVLRDYREDVSRLRPALKYAGTGHGVPGFEVAVTKADLYRQMRDIERQLSQLNDDGSTPQQQRAVRETLPNPNPNVAAPTTFNFNPGEVGPTPSHEPPQSIPVQAPKPSLPASQADIDALVAQRTAERG